MKGLILMVSAMTLLGCKEHVVPAQPVSWYLAHDVERNEKVVWCIDDAERERTADCQNAMEAKRRLAMGSQSTLAPLDWNAPVKKP